MNVGFVSTDTVVNAKYLGLLAILLTELYHRTPVIEVKLAGATLITGGFFVGVTL